MQTNLFPTNYPDDFEQCWKLYRSRAEMPSSMRKDEAATAWQKSRHRRPPLLILLRCVNLYLDQLEGTKRVYQRGRDERVEYCKKLHLATFLNQSAWRNYEAEALAQRDAIVAEAPAPVRRAFRASDHDAPEATTRLRPWREVAAELQARR